MKLVYTTAQYGFLAGSKAYLETLFFSKFDPETLD